MNARTKSDETEAHEVRLTTEPTGVRAFLVSHSIGVRVVLAEVFLALLAFLVITNFTGEMANVFYGMLVSIVVLSSFVLLVFAGLLGLQQVRAA